VARQIAMACYNYDKAEEEERLEPDEDDARLTPPGHGTPTTSSREGQARRTTTLCRSTASATAPWVPPGCSRAVSLLPGFEELLLLLLDPNRPAGSCFLCCRQRFWP
jgi:hypothetical protein